MRNVLVGLLFVIGVALALWSVHVWKPRYEAVRSVDAKYQSSQRDFCALERAVEESFSAKSADILLLHIARRGLRDGKPELAREFAAQAIRLQPKNPDAHDIAGDAHAALGEKERAIECYEKALDLWRKENEKEVAQKVADLMQKIGALQ